MASPAHMRRYLFRLAGFMTGYTFTLIGGLFAAQRGMPLVINVFLAFTSGTATFWQFLKVYGIVGNGPEWFGVMWLAYWGLAAPLVRWRA